MVESTMLSLSIADQYHLQLDVELDLQVHTAQWKMYLFFPAAMTQDSDNKAHGLYRPHLLQQQSLSNIPEETKAFQFANQLNKLNRLLLSQQKEDASQFHTLLANLVNSETAKVKQLSVLALEQNIHCLDRMLSMAEKSDKGKKRRYLRLASQLLSYHTHQAILASSMHAQQKAQLHTRLTNLANAHEFKLTHKDQSGRERLVDKYEKAKSVINSPYRLKRKTLRSGKLAEQLIFGFAAAIAMAFATAIAFATQRAFGNFSTPFFFSLVVSYIFKDRIKELGRNYLVDKYFKHFFQRHARFYSKYSSEAVMDIKESYFQHTNSHLSKEIADKKVYFSELDTSNEGKVLIYARHYQPQGKHHQRITKKFKDKLTLNLSRRLRALPGISREHLNYYQGDVVLHKVHKVQPIYLAIESQVNCNDVDITLYRLITSRKGIHRLESIDNNQ